MVISDIGTSGTDADSLYCLLLMVLLLVMVLQETGLHQVGLELALKMFQELVEIEATW